MYRSYQPITPASNKLLKQRWDDTYFEEHRRKVATSKAVVDNKPPRTYMHLHLKLKKLQIEEERMATIERDNRILLEKMSQIMRTKGRVDNWNDYTAKSLNRTKRQQELLRVTHENQAILKRVLAQKPVYDHSKWEDHWLEKEGYMDSISKYPKEWYKKSAGKKMRGRKNEGKDDASVSKKGTKKGRTSPKEEKSSRTPSPGEEVEGKSVSPREQDKRRSKKTSGKSVSSMEEREVHEIKEEKVADENAVTEEPDEKPVEADENPVENAEIMAKEEN